MRWAHVEAIVEVKRLKLMLKVVEGMATSEKA